MGDNALTAQALATAVRRLNCATEEQRDAEENVREAVVRCLADGTALEVIAEALAGLRGADPASVSDIPGGQPADGPGDAAGGPAARAGGPAPPLEMSNRLSEEAEEALTPQRRRKLIISCSAEGLGHRAVVLRANRSPGYVRKVLGAAPAPAGEPPAAPMRN
ncbi:hypothetical protein [Kitasatospora acidiphila]|uniref:hypothetical protein n=1 Tax=Kitasatospora acidiphila TaxID=2567942 RepID=UPI003C763814